MMDIDTTALRSDLHRLTDEIRLLKRELRRPGHDISREEAALLSRRKARMTLLCAIRAGARGRLHMTRCTRRHAALGLPQLETLTPDDQARWIGDRWREYERKTEAAA